MKSVKEMTMMELSNAFFYYFNKNHLTDDEASRMEDIETELQDRQEIK